MKQSLLRLINRLCRPFISFNDLRQNSKGVRYLDQGFTFDGISNSIHTYEKPFYWREFSAIPLNRLFVYYVKEAEVVGNGIVIEKNKVILESTIFQKEYFYKLQQIHLVLTRFFRTKKLFNNPVISLSNILEDNYYHWVMESITRLLIIEDEVDLRTCKIIINENRLPFKIESLKLFFEVEHHCVISKKTKDVLKAFIILPSFVNTRNDQTSFTDISNPAIIRKLNKKLLERLKNEKSQFPKRFLLSRAQARDRKIINEDFLLNHLDGFALIESEKLSFEDQLKLFLNGEVVISTHGAGLTNIIFSKNITTIELFPETRNPRDGFVFTQISSALLLQHHLIEYKPVNDRGDLLIDATLLHTILSIIKKIDLR